MKTYYVLWTYVANYSKLMEVQATCSEDAVKQCTFLYDKYFFDKANIYVFDTPPILKKEGGQ